MNGVKHIEGINSLRFIAFAVVFLSHTIPNTKFCYLGIDLFFVISSFLLTKLAFDEIEITGGFSKKNFFIRRSLRIYPLYYAVVLFCFLTIPVLKKSSTPLENHWMYLVFLSNFDTSNNPFPLKLLWSIAVEEQFYLLFIIISPLFKKFLYLVVASMILTSLTLTALLLKINVNIYPLISTYLLDFSVGMFFGYIFFKQKKINSLLIVMYLLVALPILFYIFTQNNYIDNYLNLPICIGFGLTTYITASISKSKWVNRLLFFRVLEYLGKYTYGLYVLSGLTITLVIGFIPLKNNIISMLLKLFLLIPVTFISYHFFEKPFLKLKEQFRNK
ncbi:MAG: acyltransferase [Flavobacterium sp.]|nr:acyltransferase [Flavobacterium sp.]